ncbi:MAG: hypothetical protein A2X94_16795 [Bdellovibrionales bacterium GWB1_55_8]|nr:MAG: hypothetical protein A2X94_16795 [Bdellovibrionales bacterium GWB1_55_8]
MVLEQPVASVTRRNGALDRLLQDDRGQATVEYILILSVAVVAAGAMARGLLGVVDRGILRFGGQLEKDLKTGRMNSGLWK